MPGRVGPGRMPAGLPLLLRHAAVPGREGRHQQHPGPGVAGEREYHGHVSMLVPIPVTYTYC